MATCNEFGGEGVRATSAEEMAAFDRLPQVLRDALGYAPGPVSSVQCAEQIERGMPPMLVKEMVEDACRAEYGVATDRIGKRRLPPCRR